MKQVLKYVGYVLLLAIAGYMIYRFYYIIGWILLAAVLSFIGEPLVNFFDKLHIRSFRMPHPISALLALLVIVLFFIGLLAVFVPLIFNQAEALSNIDVNLLGENLQEPIQWLNMRLHDFGVIPESQSMQDFISGRIKSIVDIGSVGTLIGGFISVAGNLLVGVFSILFIAFFFLKDENMFENVILILVPEEYDSATKKVIADSRNMLMRYFIGVFLEVLCVMSLISIGLWIFGVKNALLIGFFGGLMNIIPYLGPMIGTVIGIFLGVTGTLALGLYGELISVIVKLAGVFVVANFIDNNILVPMIYSKSVKSHPLEIFIVIIIGGGIAGLAGMLLAVPVYTVLRVIAKEFFNNFRVVQKLTKKMSE